VSKLHHRKGFVTVVARDPNTGQIWHPAVSVNSGPARKVMAMKRKAQKEERARFRQFKKELREAKKQIPKEHRGTVNWAEVQSLQEKSRGEIRVPVKGGAKDIDLT
jgi:hypothetical protein